jgi:hypothetical protein
MESNESNLPFVPDLTFDIWEETKNIILYTMSNENEVEALRAQNYVCIIDDFSRFRSR